MKKDLKQKRAVGLMFLALFISLALNSAIASKYAEKSLYFTSEDLQELYRKYNITENDIKFAEGKLPHYLEGTILDGKVCTMGKISVEDKVVSEWVDPRFYEYCVREGYKVMSAEERLALEEKAREEYIKKYGVDPANPKIDVVNGVPLPVEYVRELVKSGEINLKESDAKSLAISSSAVSSTPVGPYAKYGELYLWIFEAKDSIHKPTEAYLNDAIDAYARFYQFNPGTLYYYHLTEWWDA
ncbi:MAG: hypothetical protein QXL61_06980, partial [Archaeoglobaceae archaeon]